MDDFPGLLARDFGYKPQGKSAPMAPNRTTATTSAAHSSFDFGLLGSRSSSTSAKSTPIFDDHPRSGGASDDIFNDVFARPSSESRTSGGSGGFDYDSVFKEQNNTKSTSLDYDAVFREHKNAKTSSLPVFDKPVYDDDADIFDGLPGVKSASSTKFDDLFSSIGTATSPPKVKNQTNSSPFDDLLGNLGKKEAETKKESSKATNDSPAFDDLLPGFGRSSSPGSSRSASGSGQPPRSSSNTTKVDSHLDDPFSVFESTSTPVNSSASAFTDPLEEISKFSSSGSATFDDSSNKAAFDDIDPLDSLGRTAPPVASETNKRGKDRSPLGTGKSMDDTYSDITKQPVDKYPVDHSDEIHSQRKMPNDNFQDAHETMFDIPTGSADFNRFVGQNVAPPSYENVSPKPDDSSSFPRSNHIPESSDDIWLTVSEVPLYTQTTSAPPPSRPPPPRPPRKSKSDSGSSSSFNVRKNVDEYSSFSNTYNQSSGSARSAMSPPASQLDELEDFAMGRSRTNVNTDGLSAEDLDATSATAAMKEAMDKAEAKFRQMREREYAKAGRGKEGGQLDRDLREKQERLDRERIQREREEEEREREKAHQIEREREEKEREQRRLEQRAKEIERERARQAVERATREARERAAADARARAERAQAGRAAAEARERAERAAVQRAQAEARERAAAEARERAEKAAAEARERANAEAREKAAATAKAETDARRKSERAAVERAAAEARERAAAEARERAAAAARASQQNSENDLESFFQSRASSAPKSRTSAPDPFFENQNKGGPEVARRTSVSTTASMKKASSTTNIVDDLSAIFGAPSSAGEFQEVEGESEERRRARLERHQRTQERAAKALAEKNERDLQVQREQAERHRIAETLDAEIKRWAAGKEGNLRALLSTMQYVLWPECGWQPVSLTDLITAAAVKKVYRKATLCIHPDKVQQKGANLQQKYIAEKVFDLLKEAWNKFNSEELF